MSFLIFRDALEHLASGKDFSREEAREALDFIIKGEANDAQTAAFLFGLRQKGETAEELTGFVEAMRNAVIRINVNTNGAVDLCGTGGDHSGSFNISTAAMFVAAGAGVPVLKHGNRSISSKSGSYDVLEALGVIPDLKPENARICFENCGLTFMYAPLYHPAMKHVMPSRRELAMRTFFNIMGPLLNPAGVERQVVGTYSIETARMSAQILSNLGAEAALTVHSEDGMDEFSTASNSTMFVVRSGSDSSEAILEKKFDPTRLGIERVEHADIQGGDKEMNAGIILNILNEKATGPQTDIVVLNAASAILVSGKATTFEEAIDLARQSISSGCAFDKLESMKEISQKLHNV